MERERFEKIDYNKLGKVIAENVIIPKPPAHRPVTVNIDKNGVSVEDGNTSTTILNNRIINNFN